MAAGDEIGLTESLYHELIGRYVSTIEVIVKRGNLKDQKIAILETQLAQLEAAAAKGEPKEGDIAYGDAEGNPPA